MSDVEEQLAAEAVRLYWRYAKELVEGLGFCPYAERARLDGQTEEFVIADPIPTDEKVLEVVERAADEERIAIGLVLLPRLVVSRRQLGRWVEVLRKAHASARDGRAVLAIEGFHPDADADTSNAERLTPFVRRTPDPTLQLTRLSVLDKIRRGTPQGTGFFDPDTMDVGALMDDKPKRPLHERIADTNLETVERLGVADVEAIMLDILRDRDETYARIDPSIAPRVKSGAGAR